MRLRWSADQHRLARHVVGAQPAASVGQHDDPAACLRRCPDAVHDRVDAAALVEVGAAEKHQHAAAAGIDRADPARVPEHRRRREPREVGDRDVVCRRADGIGGRHPAGAEHDRDVMPLDAGEFGQPLRGLCRSLDRVRALTRRPPGRRPPKCRRPIGTAAAATRSRSRPALRPSLPRRRPCRGSAPTAGHPRTR